MATATDQKAIIRSLRDYLAGQVVGMSRDETLLDELLKCALCFRHNGLALALGDEPLAPSYSKTFEEIKRDFPGFFAQDDVIRFEEPHLRVVHDSLSGINFDDPRRDIVGDIYEAFIGSLYRGQEGQFFTPANAVDALVQITDPDPGDKAIDPACGSGAFLLRASLHASQKNGGRIPELYGVDKDGYLARLAGIHLAIQFKKSFRIVCADSLAWSDQTLRAWWDPSQDGDYSLVLTNPPFGARIVALTGEQRHAFALAHKWKLDRQTNTYSPTAEFNANTPPQVLFLERCLRLLRDGGRLGIVLPESVLSNVNHRYVMEFVSRQAVPEVVIGMPEALFKTSGKGGTHTKVCLLVLRKGTESRLPATFMAEAKWCGHDSRGRAIDRDELPEILERYRAFSSGERLDEDRLGFTVRHEQLARRILAPKYHDPEPRKVLGRMGSSHELIPVEQLLSAGQLSITTGHEVGKLAYGSGEIPFVRTTDISNWEIKVDPKHSLSLDIYKQYASKQDVREGDLLMVRDGTYLIGTAAYVTAHDTRIVFQSHLYKLRLVSDDHLNPFLLLAILSSQPVRGQIKSLAFTQDIIDSLGDRIRELLLPVPRSRDRRAEITATVRKAIADRVEARELARDATLRVAE